MQDYTILLPAKGVDSRQAIRKKLNEGGKDYVLFIL